MDFLRSPLSLGETLGKILVFCLFSSEGLLQRGSLVQQPVHAQPHDESSRSYALAPAQVAVPIPETESPTFPSRSSVEPVAWLPGARHAESPPSLGRDLRSSAARLDASPVARCLPVLSEEPSQVHAPVLQHCQPLRVFFFSWAVCSRSLASIDSSSLTPPNCPSSCATR